MHAMTPQIVVWKPPLGLYGLWLAVFLLLVMVFHNGLAFMVDWWYRKEEYSHGFLIPPVAAFMIWQQRDRLERMTFKGSWWGVATVAVGLLMFLAGELSAIVTIVQYAFVVVLAGLTLAAIGREGIRLVWPALGLLLLMVPLPKFFYHNLSASLQLLSSSIGVQFIRAFDIGVMLSGNVIDLGDFKLQVVEACSGLRYLFPLVTLGIIVATFFKVPLWKRFLLVASTLPIAVLMNSLRIGVIGISVDYWGQVMAEGLLHEFEGFGVFMACFGLLLLEMWLLNYLSFARRGFLEVFAIEYPAPTPATAIVERQSSSVQFQIAALLVTLMLLPAWLLPNREEHIPPRIPFDTFPMAIGEWQGQRSVMEQAYIDELKFTDYLLADYARGQDNVNLYISYYATQREGQSVHSPRTCLPGGGWEMTSLTQTSVPLEAKRNLEVNRVETQLGTEKQLVYYWFAQRGRQITDEYLVKWYLFWDALTRNRSDGALVRLTTSIKPGASTADADRRLQEFARQTVAVLPPYLPE